jgi:U4/U6.U5 tri-snRNP component SNU23
MPEAPKGTNVQFRREWDKEEYAERAKQKDDAERERMKENGERMKQGIFKNKVKVLSQ